MPILLEQMGFMAVRQEVGLLHFVVQPLNSSRSVCLLQEAAPHLHIELNIVAVQDIIQAAVHGR